MPADHQRFQRDRKSFLDEPSAPVARDQPLPGDIPTWDAPVAPDLPASNEMQQSIRVAIGIAGLLVLCGIGFFVALPWFQHNTKEVPELARVEAVLDDGKVTIRGTFPSEESAEEAKELAGAAVGAENVIMEYDIDEGLAQDNVVMSLEVGDLVLFETGSDALSPGFTPALDISVTMLTRAPDATLTLVGHTDDVGSPESNLELASNRVNAIAQYIEDAGIGADRISAIPKGESEPIADNSSEEGRRLNRRVEILLGNVLGGQDPADSLGFEEAEG